LNGKNEKGNKNKNSSKELEERRCKLGKNKKKEKQSASLKFILREKKGPIAKQEKA